MSDLDDRIAAAPQTLAELLKQPFPSKPAEPNDSYAWEFYQAFLADAPRRLVRIIGADYHDPERAEPGEEESLDDYEKSYREYFTRAITATEAQWGAAQRLMKPGYRVLADTWGRGERLRSAGVPFDDALFEFDNCEIAFWVKDDRVALLHYAAHSGDGDFQVSVCACVVPSKA
jgi:hypothetical protein